MKVLIIPGSLRPNTVGDKVIPYIKDELTSHEGVEVVIATQEDIKLPLYDVPHIPAFQEFEYPSEVQKWAEKVEDADAFIFLVPEYNANVTAVQKNAMDWLYRQWKDKKSAVVTYNYYDKKSSAEAIIPSLNSIGTKFIEPIAGLKIGEELDRDGTVLDEATLKQKLEATIEAFVKA